MYSNVFSWHLVTMYCIGLYDGYTGMKKNGTMKEEEKKVVNCGHSSNGS